ncbi:MAG: hypothetical protein E7599_01075 [Ruminococcaceae bacterium]|nr:hypothetical protein [Oscillospiraceae bacterium]
MSQTKKARKRRFNALDVTIVLLVLLMLLGMVGRVLLDRRNSRGMETRTVSFTCLVEKDEVDRIAVGSVLKDTDGNEVAKITELLTTTVYEERNGDSVTEYHRVTGNMAVRGYETKKGVFCSASGLVLRINTTLSLYHKGQMQVYINDIVENGQ